MALYRISETALVVRWIQITQRACRVANFLCYYQIPPNWCSDKCGINVENGHTAGEILWHTLAHVGVSWGRAGLGALLMPACTTPWVIQRKRRAAPFTRSWSHHTCSWPILRLTDIHLMQTVLMHEFAAIHLKLRSSSFYSFVTKLQYIASKDTKQSVKPRDEYHITYRETGEY